MSRFETVWTFKTARFLVSLAIAQDYGYQYDGDDPDGETQAKLDNGEYVAFDSRVTVELDGRVIGEDNLGGSVYGANECSEFWRAHWNSAAKYRNTLAQKYRHCVICHYFPDMVAQAVAEARATLANRPKLRVA